jgi:cytochrome c-type biogenesis protein CcmH
MRRRPRHRAGVLTVLATLALAALAVPAATVAVSAVAPRTTLPIVESQAMCVTCKIPLTVAQSPQADRERAFIQELIDQGQSETQIKQALVAQYGPQVLALPGTSGFDLTAYLVPIALAVFVAGLLALMLPRWRRRVRIPAAAAAGAGAATGGASGATNGEQLTPADAARLEADLARFD